MKLKLENCLKKEGDFSHGYNWLCSKAVLFNQGKDTSLYSNITEDISFLNDPYLKKISYFIKINGLNIENEINIDDEKIWITFEKDGKDYAVWYFKSQVKIFLNTYKSQQKQLA